MDPEHVDYGDLYAGSQIGEYVLDRPLSDHRNEVWLAYKGVEKAVLKTSEFIGEESIGSISNENSMLEILDGTGGVPSVRDFYRGKIDLLFLEYKNGEDGDVFAKSNRIESEGVVELGQNLSAVLADVHAKGVVHCEVKPPNMKIDRDYSVSLLDFELARKQGKPDGRLLGTPLFMSPEQARFEAASPAWDMFSAGNTMYFFDTGRLAFKAFDSDYFGHELLVGHLDEGDVANQLAEYEVHGSGNLLIRTFLERCWELDSEKRISAEEAMWMFERG